MNTGMRIVISVTRKQSGELVCGLARACQRNNVRYSLFFTGAGVTTLDEAEVVECATQADEGIACEASWEQLSKGEKFPDAIALGSQTDHSRLIKTADRLVTL